MRAKSTLLILSMLPLCSQQIYANSDPYPEGNISYTSGEKSFTMALKDHSRLDLQVRYGIRVDGTLVTGSGLHTSNHQLYFELPDSYHDGNTHSVVVWAVNIREDGSSPGSHSSYYAQFPVTMSYTPPPPPAALSINWSDADNEIGYGDNVSLSWSATNVSNCAIKVGGALISQALSDTKVYTGQKSSQNATIECTDLGGKTVTQSSTLAVRPDQLPNVDYQYSQGTKSFLAKAIDPDRTDKPVNLNFWILDPDNKRVRVTYKPTRNNWVTFDIPEIYHTGQDHTVQLSAGSFYENGTYDSSRYSIDKFIVNIAPTPPEPTATLSLTDTSVPFDGSTSIQWNSNNASSCSLNGTLVAMQGQQTLDNLQASKQYTLICQNESGDSVTETASINIEPTISFEASDFASNVLRGKLNVDGTADVHELKLNANYNVAVTFYDGDGNGQANEFTVNLPKELRTGLTKDVTFTLYDYSPLGTLLGTKSHTESFAKRAWFKEELEQNTSQDITITLADNEQYCLHSQVSVSSKASVTINGNNAEIIQCGLMIENEQETDLFENYIKTTNLGLLYFENIGTLNVNKLSGRFKPQSSESLKHFIEGCENTPSCQSASNDDLAEALWWSHWYKLAFSERVVFDHSFIYTETVDSVNLSNLNIQDFAKGIFISNAEKNYSYDIDNIQFDGIVDNLHQLIPFKLDLYGAADGDKNTVSPSIIFSELPSLEGTYTNAFNNIVDFTEPSASMIAGFKYFDTSRDRVATLDEKLCIPYGTSFSTIEIEDLDAEGRKKVIPSPSYQECVSADNANIAIVVGKSSQASAFCEENALGEPLSCSRTIDNVKTWNNGPAIVYNGRHDHGFITDIQCNVGENPFEDTLDLGSHGDNCVYVSYGKKVTISDVETHSIRGAIVKVRGVLSHIENVRGDNALFAVSLQTVDDSAMNISDNDKFFENKADVSDLAPYEINRYTSYIKDVSVTNSKQALVHIQAFNSRGAYRNHVGIGDMVDVDFATSGWGSSTKAAFICLGSDEAFNNGERPIMVDLSNEFEGLESNGLLTVDNPVMKCISVQ